MEIWKDITGYENLYQVSSLGRIKSLYNYRGKNNILKPRLKRGYYQIGLRKNGKRSWYAVHRLVAKEFLSNPNNLPFINHKDENKINNNVNNLEWCTASYNNTYGNRIEKVISKTSKKVCQYDLNGNFINEYPSLAEASRITKTHLTSISNCCRGIYKKAAGYIWKYKSEVMLNADDI